VNPAPAPLNGGQSYPLGEIPAGGDAAAGVPWWLALEHAPLDGLIRRALADNHEVQAARERINQALAAQRRAGSALWPQLEVDAGLDREVQARGREPLDTRRTAGATLQWEPDLFGRLGSTRQARAAEAWARVYEAEEFRLSLSVDVAETYFGLVEQRWLLALLGEQLATANALGRIIGQRYAEGLISKLDVLQQQTQVAELESQIPVAAAALQDLQNRLGALLGSMPAEAAPARVGEGAAFPEIGAHPRLERADELLRRRPDLRRAQALLVAADAETGRALAERLPRLTLTADALRVEGRVPGVTSVALDAGLVQPLLDWGARRAEWVRARAVYRERLAAYSQAYLRAIWEVEALVQNESRQRELLESLDRQRALLDATIRQARSRYDAGLTDYLPVLSATQQLYGVERRLVRERRRLTSLRIALHRALGGPATSDVVKDRGETGRITR
jgi:NodT family efflux transporter outer membrane factor (OMF) lipoprotein